jgi:hypothetical protein
MPDPGFQPLRVEYVTKSRSSPRLDRTWRASEGVAEAGAVEGEGRVKMTAADSFNLERFVTAQAPVFETVLAELRAGRRRTHWMWLIFPQAAPRRPGFTASVTLFSRAPRTIRTIRSAMRSTAAAAGSPTSRRADEQTLTLLG